MNDDRSTHGGPDGQTLESALAAAERILRSGHAPTATDLDALERLAAADPVGAKRLRKRLSRVFAFAQLRTREVPDRWLDGLYDDVYAASSEPLGRSRMSLAFLDAPHSLQRWRQTAVAACLLLAVGAGWNAMRADPVADDGTAGVRLLFDDPDHPLNNLLERDDFNAGVPDAPGSNRKAVPVLNGPNGDPNMRPRRGRSPFGGGVWFRLGNGRGNGNGVLQLERKGAQEEN